MLHIVQSCEVVPREALESEVGLHVMATYFVYILQSTRDDSRYIGVTTDLRRRIEEHNTGKNSYTSAHAPYRCTWYCAFQDKRLAYAFERYLKSSSGFAFTKKRLIP